MPCIPPDFLSRTVDHYLHVVDRAQKASINRRVAAVVKRCNDRDFELPLRVLREACRLQLSIKHAQGVVMLVQHLFLPSPSAKACSTPPPSNELMCIDSVILAASLELCKVPLYLRIEEAGTPWPTDNWLAALSGRTHSRSLWNRVPTPEDPSNTRRLQARYVTCDIVASHVPLEANTGIKMTIVEDLGLWKLSSGCRRTERHLHWHGMHDPQSYPTPTDAYAIKVVDRLRTQV